MAKNNNIKIFKPNDNDSLSNLFIEDGISAGFPSPASDFEESRISLEKVVVKNKEATFYVGKWISYCSACGKEFQKERECPICGNKLNRKLIKKSI